MKGCLVERDKSFRIWFSLFLVTRAMRSRAVSTTLVEWV